MTMSACLVAICIIVAVAQNQVSAITQLSSLAFQCRYISSSSRRDASCQMRKRITSSEYPKNSSTTSISNHNHPIQDNPQTPTSSIETSRRSAVLQLASISVLSGCSLLASASEIDATGQLFSPKNEMIKGGGSAAARGIPLKPMEREESMNRGNKSLLKSGEGLIQNVYETRFITYLTRFLLVFDPAASAWWKKNTKPRASGESNANGNGSNNVNYNSIANERFAEFAESVEVGLADYFVGPYGSYASVAAAKAGITAAEPARSVRGEGRDPSNFFSNIFVKKESQPKRINNTSNKGTRKQQTSDEMRLARQGILNLLSLLKARYTSIEEKQQLAILFSLISSPDLQPVNEIRGLLGEIDNGTIAAIELLDISDDDDTSNERDFFRLSSRQGGGFAKDDTQVVKVDPPAPLGDEYKAAKIQTIMKPTSRILRINVVDGGEGYDAIPEVILKQRKGLPSRQCEACAILNRKGGVSEVIVTDPGFGYGGRVRKGDDPIPPTVEIKPRRSKTKTANATFRHAKAEAELEYKITGVEIIDGGSGYLFDQPPEVSISVPDVDPDWFVKPVIRGLINDDDDENNQVSARVSLMKSGHDGVVFDTSAVLRGGRDVTLGVDVLQYIESNPIGLLPSNVRPRFSKFISDESTDAIENGIYYIPSLPRSSSYTDVSTSDYRSIDLFGGVGKAPVTKNALSLSANQYYRLALSGAICTVLVRTALNPLELVKTKIQLKNDDEIIELAMKKSLEEAESKGEVASTTKPAISTNQVIQSLAEVRGPFSLFQSADITFLTSIVFGMFGFGATELFRRSFSVVFFDEAGASSPNEFVLLAAAGFATLLTCAAGAPFEILRVRSMSSVESLGVKKVFQDFVEQNRSKESGVPLTLEAEGLQPGDIKPLWSSFTPIASRELPFAVTKFLVFDLASGSIADFLNNSHLLGDEKIQVGVGTFGLLLSAFAGALAGIAGAFISHPADLILTLTSASSRDEGPTKDWRSMIKELLAADGGVLNLFAGFPARAVFFFLVIGLQFFLYDYIKTLLDVGTDDLTLVLDVFYAIRQGLIES
mmetsp:Transcript_19514/g.42090  ORF Transcript_19514/g.42090 Transcript_19514/m.42090 type:complete len:1057 (+) Transcript_19514:108-3278(+)